MIKITKLSLIFFIVLNLTNSLLAENTFFEEGKKKYDEKKYEESKFLLQRSIVFNPRDIKSYLYLAKIFNKKKKEDLEENNLNTVILLNPKNEEAIYDLILLSMKKSNFSKADELINTFDSICVNLCRNSKKIKAKLKSSLN